MRFINNLTHTKGDWAGKPFNLRPWQRGFIEPLFGTLKDNGRRQYRTCYVEIPRKQGKALALDTPLPMPGGWTTIGDLQIGDRLFDERGEPCRVTAMTPIMLDRPCYEVIFSDRSRIIADAEHEWRTERKRTGRPNGKRWRPEDYIRTTREIAQTLAYGAASDRVEWNHAIGLAAPLRLPCAELPVPPYTLGAWLGDGNQRYSWITAYDREVVESIAAEGVAVAERPRWGRNAYLLGSAGRSQRARNESLQGKLRMLGVLANKHVPSLYQRASIEQRMELLRGLMDTDGYVSLAGECEFTTTTPALRDGMMELLCGLGFKPLLGTGRAMLAGKDCGEKYRIHFFAFNDWPVFRLRRKADRLPPRPAIRQRSRYRKIIAAHPIESVPVRCISVDSPSHLYLAGRSMIPTHNSEIAAAIALYMLVGDGEQGAEVYSAAVDRDQASLVFNVAAQMVRNDPVLSKRLEIIDSRRRILDPVTNSTYVAIPAEAGGRHGYNASAVIYDEIHAAPNRDLYDVLTTSTGARAQPLIFVITTAGYDRNSICWELHQYAEKVRDGIIDDPSFLPVLYSAPLDADWTSPEVWRSVNPALGDFRSLEEFEIAAKRAIEVPGQQNAFRRLYLCQWCVAYGTLVTMADGSRRPAEELREGDVIVSFDEESRRLVRGVVRSVRENGARPVMEITSARGRSVTVTDNHKFWAQVGRISNRHYEWVPASELRPGAHVAVALGSALPRGSRCSVAALPVREAVAFDRIASVAQLPPQPTIGIEVEQFHTHVTNGFITHNTEQSSRWLPMDAWDEGSKPVIADAGDVCYAGLDLASTTDITALVLWFPHEDGSVDLLPYFWVPEEGIRDRSRRAGVPYDEWARDGHIFTTPGNVTDYDAVRTFMRDEIAVRYAVRELAYDRWNSSQLITQLVEDGANCVPIGQGYASLSAPSKEFEALVLGRKIRHGGNPVLRWMAANVAIEQDAAGNIKPSKAKSNEKIDGIVAAIMAGGRASLMPAEQPVTVEFW